MRALPLTPPLSSPGPTPSPSPTGLGEGLAESFADQRCGSQDGTLCSLLYRMTDDIEQARTLSYWISVPLFVLAVVVVAVLVRWVVLRAIRRWVSGVETEGPRRRGRLDVFETADPIGSERRVQRAKAIGSILSAVVSIVVWTAAVFLVLPSLGVDITGLVAGAGIVGIAVGFGAQTLVQDFVSGLFMIAEDQYGVGDVIDMGEASGVVEAVGLRTTRLRSVDGTVWHIRNGEVVRVGNMSQGWSRAVLDVGVGYGEDVTRIMELLKALGLEMRADEDWGDKFLDDPEVWGVEALAADQVTIRMIIKTVPLEQWVVAREMRRRIKHAFDLLGIEIPFPQRTVWMRTEGPGKDQPLDGAGPDERRADQAGGRRSRQDRHSTDEQDQDDEHDGEATRPHIPLAPVDTTRGEAGVAREDAPAPGTGEPFGSSDEPDPRRRRG